MKYVIDVPDFDKYNMPSPTKGRVVAVPITIGDTTFNIPTEMAFIEPYTEPDEIKNNKVNLCSSCELYKEHFPECGDVNVLFGDGVGNDNVCCCNGYQANTVDRKTIEDAQNQGWKFANDIINGLNIYERRECFGYGLLHDILNSMSYQEAVDHFEIWKTERNDLIKVGDELKSTLYEDYRIVVFEDKDNCYEGLGIKGNMVFHAVWQKNHNYEKTGRHFSQVTDLLKEMKGECDEVFD